MPPLEDRPERPSRPSAAPFGSARLVIALPLLAAALLLAPPSAQAQGAEGQEAAPVQRVGAQEAFRDAEAAYVAALTTAYGRAPTPDDALWRQAIDAAERAVAAAREEAVGELFGPAVDALREALGLRARVYSSVGWHSRAFSSWEEFLVEGGDLAAPPAPPSGLPAAQAAEFPSDSDLLTAVLNQLAFSRYAAGDSEGAKSYYLTILDFNPSDPEALRWLGRIAFEEGDTATAIDIWSRLVEVAPDDEGASFFLELSREREEVGAAASDAYRAGIRAYEAGDLQAALERFESAYAANSDFADAAVWAARSALEAGRPAVAEPYWEAALAADPDDARSAWFLELTRAQLRWGAAAANEFYAGQAAYGEGDLDTATTHFLGAADENPRYVDAWVWAARSTQEAGRPEEAIPLWQEVLRLDPADSRARWFIEAARQQLEYGSEAGSAYVQAVGAYQAGDYEGARVGFIEATAAAPDFVAAWSYLAGLEFQLGDYEAAAAAYDRALELDPGNEDFAFFAAEARRLAGIEEAEEQDAPAGPAEAEEAGALEEQGPVEPLEPEEPAGPEEPGQPEEPEGPGEAEEPGGDIQPVAPE